MPVVSHKPKTALAAAVALALGATVVDGRSAQAATFSVINLNDNGAGSLRQAIEDANGAAGADTVTFQAGLTGTITLTSGQLSITDSVEIQGPGAAVLSVSGNDASRVFYLYNSSTTIDVTISGLTITGGSANIGAGIVDFDENLTLDGVTIRDNNASGDGGGLWADGFNMNLHIQDSTLSGNTSGDDGGAIYVEDTGGPLLIQRTVISGNQATGQGGGIYFYDPDNPVTLEDSTISGNSAGGLGGGVYLYSPDDGLFTIRSTTVSGNTGTEGGGIFLYSPDHGGSIENSTISGNQATAGGGGGVYLDTLYNFALHHITVAGNSATGQGGGVFLNSGTLPIDNSIVADNTADSDNDLAGNDSQFDLMRSLVESPGTASINDLGGNLLNQDPLLGALASNGGLTQTHLPALTSAAVNAGNSAFTVDQRGQARPVGAAVDMGAVEVNPGTVQLAASADSIAENAGTVTITAMRTGGTDGAVSVALDTSDVSAVAPGDYMAVVNAAFNWAGGDGANKTLNVTIVDDTLDETDEAFNATISNPQGGVALGVTTTETVTILDDDVPGTLQFSAPTYSVTENGVTATITVTRTGGSDGAVSVNYATSDGSAAQPGDYTTAAGTLNWADGDAANKTFTVPIIDDFSVESNETVNLTLSTPTGGAALGAQSTAVLTITDFEPGVLQFSAPTYSVTENGGTATITVTRTGGSEGAVSVNYASSDGSAAQPGDYTTTMGALNWADGDAANKTFTVPIIDDSSVESNETVNLTLSTPTGGAALGAQNTAVLTITEFEPGVLQFSAPAYSVTENGVTATITVTRTGGSDGAVSVNYATSDGSAAQPGDYTTAAGTLNWADGDATDKTFTVPINDDSLVEGNETANLTLSGPTDGATLGVQSTAVLTIADEDNAGTLQFGAPAYSVAENGGTATITVTRTGGTNGAVAVTPALVTRLVGINGPAAGAVSATFATSDGTATQPADYTTATGTLNWADGDGTDKTFTIPIIDDAMNESDETINVSLGNPLGGAGLGIISTAAVTITDNDAVAEPTPVPTLSGTGKLVLAGLLGALAWLTRRRRWDLFALLLLVAYGAITPDTVWADPAARKAAKERERVIAEVVELEQAGDKVVIRLADQSTVTVPANIVKTKDKRQSARRIRGQRLQRADIATVASTLGAGAVVQAKIKKGPDDAIKEVKIIMRDKTN